MEHFRKTFFRLPDLTQAHMAQCHQVGNGRLKLHQDLPTRERSAGEGFCCTIAHYLEVGLVGIETKARHSFGIKHAFDLTTPYGLTTIRHHSLSQVGLQQLPMRL